MPVSNPNCLTLYNRFPACLHYLLTSVHLLFPTSSFLHFAPPGLKTETQERVQKPGAALAVMADIVTSCSKKKKKNQDP